MTPSKKILQFLRDNFVFGINTFVSHKWLSEYSLEITDTDGDTAIVSYDETEDVVTLV